MPADLIRLSTGITGLDEILAGGLIPGGAYLVRGGPGVGKTILGLHFLNAGSAGNERTLCITLSEAESQVVKNAAALGLELKGVSFLDLSPTSDLFSAMKTYDIFSPSEVERDPITRKIVEQVEAIQPQRVYVDAITQFRYLASDGYQFRRQTMSFIRFLLAKNSTVLFSSEYSERESDADLQFLSDGIIDMRDTVHGRTLSVTKFRGSGYRSGRHSMTVSKVGIRVFPALLPETKRAKFEFDVLSSSVAGLDEMLHGGVERGTVTLITGPSGVGKTSVGLEFVKEAANRGGRSVVYSFEEDLEIMQRRAEGIAIPAHTMIDRGTLALVKVSPLQYTPGEFAHVVRREVTELQARIIMLDSVSGYRLAMDLDEQEVIAHLFMLCKYLQSMGVTVFLTREAPEEWSEILSSATKLSCLADNILFLRYLERHSNGEVEVRKGLGVLKKRLSDFDRSLRELEITSQGVHVGPPIKGLSGILAEEASWTEAKPRRGLLTTLMLPHEPRA